MQNKHETKKHILFFDIDGTIVDEKTGIIPESTKRAIHTARENGHILVLNTGRCKAILQEKILRLGFQGVIGGCGTYIEYEGEELLHKTIPQQLCKEIAKDLTAFHIDGFLEGKEHTYLRNDIFIPIVKQLSDDESFYKGDKMKYWDDKMLQFDKMALWHDETSDMDGFIKKYDFVFDFVKRDATFFEAVPSGYSKGTGIEFLIKKLGISKERTIAVGDSANDISMFQYAGTSIGLNSNRTEVLKLVDYVTDTVLNDGVWKGLEYYGIV